MQKIVTGFFSVFAYCVTQSLYPDSHKIDDLVKEINKVGNTNCEKKFVQNWFGNERQRIRKHGFPYFEAKLSTYFDKFDLDVHYVDSIFLQLLSNDIFPKVRSRKYLHQHVAL